MFSERKFSKDRVIPKGYVELLENRVDVLETGLREALLRLNQTGGIHLPHSPTSNPPSPTAANFLDHSRDLSYNITQALKELHSMKIEREKGTYSEHEHDSDHTSEHGDASSRRDSAEASDTMFSAKTEDLATPLTSPANSPPQKTLFLPPEMSQPLFQPQYPESGMNFYQAYYDRQTNNSALNLHSSGPYMYDELNLSWLDSVALDETYLQNSNEFQTMGGL
jgi:hypothetical protein